MLFSPFLRYIRIIKKRRRNKLGTSFSRILFHVAIKKNIYIKKKMLTHVCIGATECRLSRKTESRES